MGRNLRKVHSLSQRRTLGKFYTPLEQFQNESAEYLTSDESVVFMSTKI